MAEHRGSINEDRAATQQEIALVQWLLQRGKPSAAQHAASLEGLRVVSRRGCGCASVGFLDEPGAGLDILSDYEWEDERGHLFGVFVFARRGRLAGLEVWSIDGRATPTSLPDPKLLRPIG